MICQFEKISEHRYTCTVCGRPAKSRNGIPTRECKGKIVPLTVLQTAVNAAAAVGRILKSGYTEVTESQFQHRLSVCRGCENYLNGWCKACNCNLNLKAQLKTEYCPLHYWPGESEKIAVVICCRGQIELTHSTVKDCLRETVDIIIVDDSAEEEQHYTPIDNEQILKSNGIGWLKATNIGLLSAYNAGYKYIVLLNNDVEIAKDFFAGLKQAQEETKAGIVCASYNGGWKQLSVPLVFANAYVPTNEHVKVTECDGTCVLLTRDTVEKVGLLDETNFGKYGWYAMCDYQRRAEEHGIDTYVTRLSYCKHLGARTAYNLYGSNYWADAKTEGQAGYQNKQNNRFKRNLIYHVCPLVTNNIWYCNLLILKSYLNIFNGKKVIAIGTGDRMAEPSRIKEVLDDGAIDYIECPNDLLRHEMVSFPSLLDKVYSLDADEITFYGHAKGVSHPNNQWVKDWTKAMYDWNLGRLDLVEQSMKSYPCYGIYQRKVRPPHFPIYSDWHYAGTFFWFNNWRLFSHHDWREVDNQKWGIEGYLSRFFESQEARCELYAPLGFFNDGLEDI